jgi:ubiquinone/menaquinone biosynthesis C-methylase UbiE
MPSLTPPATDPTPIFELFRGHLATELLVAAVTHFGVFDRLAERPLSPAELQADLGLADRPMAVLMTALKAFELVCEEDDGRFAPTALAREHLTPGSPFDVSGYLRLGAEAPGVAALIQRLVSNRPAGTADAEEGAAFIYRAGLESAMEKEESARRLTLALAGRARNVAPVLADRCPLPDARVLLDVGGGTGLYSIAWLERHPALRAIVWDRPEVLKVAASFAEEAGVADRLQLVAGDMFVDPVPAGADVVLLSNVLHDWDVPACQALLDRCAGALPAGGRVLIHDVFLDDDLAGPLPVALYSASLFSLTEGRAYSAREYKAWLTRAGLTPGQVLPTLVHCGVLPAFKG